MSEETRRFVSRAGDKLQHALTAFSVDPKGLRCADLGCHIGGFTDCLLQAGAASVVAVDTGYGVLAWSLRQHAQVDVRERTNALHANPPENGVDLVVIDLGWTPQRHALPAAAQWLADGGRIITLVKPHYELDQEARKAHLVNGRLDDEKAAEMLADVEADLPTLNLHALGSTKSPIRGGKSSRGGKPGNCEFFLLLERSPEGPHAS